MLYMLLPLLVGCVPKGHTSGIRGASAAHEPRFSLVIWEGKPKVRALPGGRQGGLNASSRGGAVPEATAPPLKTAG